MPDLRSLRERFGLGPAIDAGTQQRLDAILWQLAETHALLEARMPLPADEAPVSMAPAGAVRDGDGVSAPSPLDPASSFPSPPAGTSAPDSSPPARRGRRKAAVA